MRCQARAACSNAFWTRSSARWASPVRRYAVRLSAGVRATTKSWNSDSRDTGFPLTRRRTQKGGAQEVRTRRKVSSWSARAALESVEIHDHDRARLEPEPAA